MKKSGFTLVELSIVLVIMGLIIASIAGGSALLRSAELKGVISEVEDYKVNIDAFRENYHALPGDLKNATSFWSGTANGNGDAQIGTGADDDDTEAYYAWKHLTLAKMIPGNYSGSGTAAVVGTNVPDSKFEVGSGMSVRWFSSPFSYTDSIGRSFSANYLVFGKNHATHNYLSASVLKPDDAFEIDKKIDDGRPNYGKVLGGNGTDGTTCTSGASASMVYDMSSSAVSCILTFFLSKR